MQSIAVFLVVLLVGLASCDVSHILKEIDVEKEITTLPPPPRPYSFSYVAGRHPGHIDRIHSESSDGSGTVKGSFSYVDPRNQVRTVDYIADAHGFYPQLSHLPKSPQQSEAVERAAQKHFVLYAKIAEEHANHHIQPVEATLPKDTVAVSKAKDRHFTLYEKIAQEHAQIAAEREAERLAFEATSEVNELQ
ncbi:larval cuticle protein LCP-17 isoform X2 [Toxorhynchites rutilus septentrionalis]|uniref:larval cuticle protein LCP-17 isoform X2 n=1 Tax=Toxorhynchites rutilus septentrionalis TaxID=329112 RepID=UPI0024789159|nr:larval cuticle protein LCP-17 isoform X2 [Toxorhynchites rutilus septentrionalis]